MSRVFEGSRYLNIQIDIIEEIAAITIYNENFDGNNWCLRDAEILEGAAQLIRDCIGKTKTKSNKKPHRKLMTTYRKM